MGVNAWFGGCLATIIVVVAGHRRCWRCWREKSKMVWFSSQGDDNNVARKRDRKFCSKTVFIGQYHSIVAEGNSPFRYVRHFGVRSPFLAQCGMCAVTQRYIALFLVSKRASCFALVQNTKKAYNNKRQLTFLLQYIAYSMRRRRSSSRLSSSLLTRHRAVVPQCRKRRAVYSWFRYICWLGVGRGSYYCALTLLALCWWSRGSVGWHAFVVFVCVHTRSYTCTVEMFCFTIVYAVLCDILRFTSFIVFASRWCAFASVFAYIVMYLISCSYCITFFSLIGGDWLNIWIFVERFVVMRLPTTLCVFWWLRLCVDFWWLYFCHCHVMVG